MTSTVCQRRRGWQSDFRSFFPLTLGGDQTSWRRSKAPITSMIAAWALAASAGATFAESGCSSRGGPGYRLANGKCVSWAQHERHKTIGDFPAGAACEHPAGCTLETGAGVKRLQHGEVKAAQ